MIYRYQKDIYKCTNCNGWVAYGDLYCKHCGYHFTGPDTDKMTKSHSFIQQWKAPFTSLFSNAFNCIQCNKRVSYGDQYCRHCGHEFTSYDVRIMRGDHNPNMIDTYRITITFIVIVIFIFVIFFSFLE